jgi:AraC family transcriptional activator of tynA and feaB
MTPGAEDSSLGRIVEISTAGVAARERFAFWRATAMRRMEPSLVDGRADQFRGRVRRVSGSCASLVDYRSDAIWMTRNRRHISVDGGDEISVGLVVGASTGAEQNDRELLLRRTELYVIDFARPVRSMLADHHELAIMLPRASVAAALGTVPSTLGGTRLFDEGIGAVLMASMSSIAAQMDRMTRAERAVALDTAAALALAAIQATLRRRLGQEHAGAGLLAAANAIIRQRCGDPELTPDGISRAIGCSRATLYRVFGGGGQSVAAAIWSARLDRAGWLLPLRASRDVPVADLAYRCGFADPASFSRMFRRRYGLSPREARGSGLALASLVGEPEDD